MTAPGYAGHPDAQLLRELSGMIGLANELGAQADAEHTSAKRIVWIPDGVGSGPLRFRPPNGRASSEEHRYYRVSLYAADEAKLLELFSRFRDRLEALLSWTAFEIDKRTEPRTSEEPNGRCGLIAKVTIKGPNYSEQYGSTVAQTVTRSVLVAEGDGSGAQVIP